MQEVPIDWGKEEVRGADLCSREDLYKYMASVVTKNLHPTTKAALLATKELPDGEGISAAYELRYKQISVTEGGVVGRCSKLEAFSTVDAKFQFDALEPLKQEQPDMDWQVVAGRVRRINLRETQMRETVRRGFADDEVDGAIGMGVMQQRVGNLVPPSRTYTQVPQYRAILELAFAGVGGSLLDPWQVRTHQDTSPMQMYLKSKSLRHLPASQRKQRALATALIEAFYAAPAEVVDPAAEGDRKLTSEQVAAGRALRSQGASWAAIAEEFGVTHQAARGAIEKAARGAT